MAKVNKTIAWREWARRCFSVFAALILTCAFANHAHAQQMQYTNSIDSTPGDISQSDGCAIGSSFQRDFVVNDDFVVDDVNLGVLLAHGERDDVAIFLSAPGTGFTLVKTLVGGTANNLNVLLDDQAGATIASHTSNDTATASTIVPPYQGSFTPTNSMNGAFAGVSSLGTWRLVFCDFGANGIDGTFFQADLFLTPSSNVADLSLNKTVASATPSSAVYTLSVTNSSGSDLTSTGVQVRDILPGGVSFVSASGTGSYNSGTGIWNVGTSIAPGQTVSIDIAVNVTAAAGTSITNEAEIIAGTGPDPDSTPNNGSTAEDDYDAVTFVVGGRIPGIPPNIGSICSAAGSPGLAVLDWNNLAAGESWTPGSSNESFTVANLGVVNFSVTTQGSFNAPLALTLDNNGGLGSAGLSLFQSIEYTNITETTSTIVTLPTAVDGLQFTVFDVDFGANDFADRLQIVGSFNGGSAFNATLTNGQVNFISGNEAIGDGAGAGNSNDGDVVATFNQPVDTITIIYGNHTTAPPDPDGQAISIHDFTFCQPTTSLSVTKISNVVSDGISTSNPKAVPGAIIRYCILVSNAGNGTVNDVSASDDLPSNVSFIPGSMLSSDSCSGTTTAEDDDATGADETDPFGMSFAAGGANGSGVVTGTADTLGPGDSLAMIFNVTLD